MTTVTLNSFEELAKLFGQDVSREQLKVKESAWEAVKVKCGRPAAASWEYLNCKAASKKSGDDGSPFATPVEISNVLGLETDTVIDSLIRLFKAGLLKLGPNETVATR